MKKHRDPILVYLSMSLLPLAGFASAKDPVVNPPSSWFKQREAVIRKAKEDAALRETKTREHQRAWLEKSGCIFSFKKFLFDGRYRFLDFKNEEIVIEQPGQRPFSKKQETDLYYFYATMRGYPVAIYCNVNGRTIERDLLSPPLEGATRITSPDKALIFDVQGKIPSLVTLDDSFIITGEKSRSHMDNKGEAFEKLQKKGIVRFISGGLYNDSWITNLKSPYKVLRDEKRDPYVTILEKETHVPFAIEVVEMFDDLFLPPRYLTLPKEPQAILYQAQPLSGKRLLGTSDKIPVTIKNIPHTGVDGKYAQVEFTTVPVSSLGQWIDTSNLYTITGATTYSTFAETFKAPSTEADSGFKTNFGSVGE